ncbi:helix-turn-helix transcriptional regulator [Streptomyces sp. B1866]|uniref:PadR family transcriptional regulator n=1 Tax=Streptomyces sp. B1866 TaxID=3075431 RepID=UPI00288F955F|nr:helix-turn-helix transcriptional regulator [Streptomyces sp. B1866]MDT3396666.1 helix-turn-helix transcriptional regulator [Streptomyces sp. B1866]
MPPVFAHGRLRLYLLKLLDEAPRHGYEVIRLLEERFQGLYAPSAGTVYPRLAKLAAEGLVTHTTEGGRKVYAITDAGRAELADRGGELADLELEIRESVAELAAEIREDVHGSARDLRREVREAAARTRTSGSGRGPGDRDGDGDGGGSAADGQDAWSDRDAWRQAKEEMRRAKEQWKEQARRAKEESRRARQDAQRARRQAREAQDIALEEVQRLAWRVQEQTREHIRAGDWQRAVWEGLGEVSRSMARISQQGAAPTDWGADGPFTARREGPPYGAGDARAAGGTHGKAGGRKAGDGADGEADGGADGAGVAEPAWARDFAPSRDPARDLDRLLDRFRDGVRDAARDHGVTPAQLAEARTRLAATAARLDALLRGRPASGQAPEGRSTDRRGTDGRGAGAPGSEGLRKDGRDGGGPAGDGRGGNGTDW